MGSLRSRMDRLEAVEAPRTVRESPLEREARRIDEEIRRLDAEIAAEEAEMSEDEIRGARRESRADDDRLANLVGLYGFDHAIRVLEEEIAEMEGEPWEA